MDWLLPTFHPAHLLRQNARLQGVVMADLKRAIGLATGTWAPKWKEQHLVDDAKPKKDAGVPFILQPSAKTVVRVLRNMHGRRVAWDVETDGRHPLICTCRCVGFYDGHTAICIPFVYRDGTKREVLEPSAKKPKHVAVWKPYYSGKELKRVLGAIQELVEAEGTRFETQNGQYDRCVMKASFGIDFPGPALPNFDDIVAHHIVSPYLPHGLGFLSSLYTDVPFYKATDEGDSWSSESDLELHIYNCRDCVTTYDTATTLRGELKELPQNYDLYEHDAWQERECQRWKETGILVDREALAFFRLHYRGVATKALAKMKELVLQLAKDRDEADLTSSLNHLLDRLTRKADVENIDDTGAVIELFNPGSLIQLRLLLAALGVPLTEKTATGQLSTAKEFLTSARKELLLSGSSENDPRVAFLDYLFAWRSATKVEGTYLQPEILPDGRVHPTFSVHVVPTGRLASKQPNFQNQPAEIRGMFVAKAGYLFVYGDWDALEMRLGALLSGDPTFLQDLADYDAGIGAKVHIINMVAIFDLQKEFDEALGAANGKKVKAGETLAKKFPECYRAAKVFAYAVAYGAGANTVYEQVREEMPDMTWEHFELCFQRYKDFRKVLFEFQESLVALGTKQGWLETAVLKRRNYFHERVYGEDSPEASKMQNFPYQGGGADVVSLANKRLMKHVEKLRRGGRGGLRRGETLEQLAQVHDELLFEVPEALAEKFAAAFKLICEQEIRKGWRLPVDVKFSKRWKPVQKRCGAKIEATGKLCKEHVKMEPVKRTETHVHWGGKCEKCGAESLVEVPKSLEGDVAVAA